MRTPIARSLKIPLLSLLLCLSLLLSVLLAPCWAQATYQQNFDALTVGTTPSGWTGGGGTLSTVTTTNAISPPNALNVTGEGNGTLMIHSGVAAVADGDFQYSTNVIISGGATVAWGPISRADAAFAGGYRWLIHWPTSTVDFYQGGTSISGGLTLVATGVTAFAQGDVAIVKTEDVGTSHKIKVWKKGTPEPAAWTQTVTDATVTAAGYRGMALFSNGGSFGTGIVDDVFEGPVGTTFAAGPATQTTAPNNSTLLPGYTPGNWNVSSTDAITNTPGACVVVAFNGSQFILPTNQADAHCWIRWRIANPNENSQFGLNPPWTDTNLAAGASTTVMDTADTTSVVHYAIIYYLRVDHSGADLWGSAGVKPASALDITGYQIDSTGAVSSPALYVYSNTALLFGDSIVQGYNATPGTGLDDAQANWVPAFFNALQVNGGAIGFGGQGWASAGSYNVPAFSTGAGTGTFNQYYSGVSRLVGGKLPFVPKYIFVEHAVNGAYVQSDVVTAWTNLRAITTSATKLVDLLPLGGQSAANLRAYDQAYMTATGDTIYIVDPSLYQIGQGLTGGGPTGFASNDNLHPLTTYAAPVATAYAVETVLRTAPATRLLTPSRLPSRDR